MYVQCIRAHTFTKRIERSTCKINIEDKLFALFRLFSFHHASICKWVLEEEEEEKKEQQPNLPPIYAFSHPLSKIPAFSATAFMRTVFFLGLDLTLYSAAMAEARIGTAVVLASYALHAYQVELSPVTEESQ